MRLYLTANEHLPSLRAVQHIRSAMALIESSFTSNRSSVTLEKSTQCISTKLSIFQGCTDHDRVTRVLDVF